MFTIAIKLNFKLQSIPLFKVLLFNHIFYLQYIRLLKII